MFEIAKIFHLRMFDRKRFVARPILTNSEEFNTQLYFLEPGQVVQKRTIEDGEMLIYVMEGRADVTIDVFTRAVEKEELTIVPKGQAFSIKNPIRSRLVLLVVQAPKDAKTKWRS